MRRTAMLLLAPLMFTHGYAQAQPAGEGGAGCQTANMASTYVPIESGIYPAIERLAMAGYIQTAFAGLRPWTRMESARLVSEAQEQQVDRQNAVDSDATVTGQMDGLIKDLAVEFAVELRQRDGECNRQAAIDSIDWRSRAIAGAPLTDGYHFAQTLTNDYGRPYGRGANLYTGISGRAALGSFASYVRVELQRTAPGVVTPVSANNAIAAADFTPAAALGPVSGLSRGRVLEAYASYTFHNNQLSLGKQALWWGPGKGGPLLFSNNAEPITMLRYDRISPFELPGFGRLLGPIRVQLFVGRLSGHQFVHVGDQTLGQPGVALNDQPFINGQKFSFKPTPNFEFSVSRTTIFAGAGAPLTTNSFLRSLFSYRNTAGKNDPGDRRSDVDVQYTIPKLHDLLKVYVDTFTDDEPFPLNYPTQSAWSPGFYLARLPHLPHADFRAEGYLTPRRTEFPGFYYFNVHYLSGYTNNRQILGSWIGRESNGYQLWSHWWFSPRSSVQVSARHQTASDVFLRGGSLRDVNASADIALTPHWQLAAAVQQERWSFPILSSTAKNNLTTTIQLSFHSKAGEF